MINVLDEVILHDGTKGYVKRINDKTADVITSIKDPVIQRTDFIADMKVVGHLDDDPRCKKSNKKNTWKNQNIARWEQKQRDEKQGIKKKEHKRYKPQSNERVYVHVVNREYSGHSGKDLEKLIKGSNISLVRIAKRINIKNASNISKIYKRNDVTKEMWNRINDAIYFINKENK